jgi:hypothetical protein
VALSIPPHAAGAVALDANIAANQAGDAVTGDESMITITQYAQFKVERDLLLTCLREGYEIVKDEDHISLPLLDRWLRQVRWLLETVDEKEAERT